MFPHYMEVAGWLALAAVVLAWVSLAAYLTVDLVTRADAATPTRRRAIAAIWGLPIIGVAGYLMLTRRARRHS